MSARALDARTVEVSFAIADGYYMYRERFKFALEDGAQSKLGAPQLPKGERKKDESCGDVEIRGLRVIGYQNADRFLDTVTRIEAAR